MLSIFGNNLFNSLGPIFANNVFKYVFNDKSTLSLSLLLLNFSISIKLVSIKIINCFASVKSTFLFP